MPLLIQTICALLVLILLAAARVPVGTYMCKCFADEKHNRAERVIYKLIGVNPDNKMRRGSYAAAAVAFGDLVLNFAESEASKGGRPFHLTPTEWRMLSTLAKAQDKLVRHAELLASIWGPGYGRELNYLRVYAHQIRRETEDDPAHPRHLLTEPGVGYRLPRGA